MKHLEALPFSAADLTETLDAVPIHCREPMQSRRRSVKMGGGPLPQGDCMSFHTILGLDLGKFKSVGCVMNVATRAQTFETIQTTPAVLHEFLVRHAGADPSGVLLVIETCDTAGWVHDLARSLGVNCTVVHTIGDERWRWRKVKRKTDKDDALKLARLALLGELPPAVHMPDARQRQKRRLMLHRRSVVTRRTQSRNAIRSIFSQ
jgi:transposase